MRGGKILTQSLGEHTNELTKIFEEHRDLIEDRGGKIFSSISRTTHRTK